EMQNVLDLFTERHNRVLFLLMLEMNLVSKNKVSHLIGNIIRDVLKYILKTAYQHKDLLCCKILADVAQTIFSENDCIYPKINSSPVYKSFDYHRMLFEIIWDEESKDNAPLKVSRSKSISNTNENVLNRSKILDHKEKLDKIIKKFISSMIINGIETEDIKNILSNILNSVFESPETQKNISEMLKHYLDEFNETKNVFAVKIEKPPIFNSKNKWKFMKRPCLNDQF
ncbi:hypothetical protein MHBO_003506, partial [Bonamia ostreae]